MVKQLDKNKTKLKPQNPLKHEVKWGYSAGHSAH